MNWNDLKKKSDQNLNHVSKVTELKKLWEELNIECNNNYSRFSIETEDAKNVLQQQALYDFKKFFLEKDFKVSEKESKIDAIYNDIKFELSVNEDYSYSIHFYNDFKLRDCKLFSIQTAYEHNENHKLVLVKDIKVDSNIDFATKQVSNLKENKKSMEALLAKKDTIKFVYEMDNMYSESNKQFDSVKEIILTFELE